MSQQRRRRMTRSCAVTRKPDTGQSGVTTIATGLACTNPYPASRETRQEPRLATISNLYEMDAAAAAFDDEYDLTLDDGRVFHIHRAQRWESSRNRATYYHLIVEARG